MLKNIRKNYKCFTLLELLVVVLIIGILASIALPQYKKAVLRSRFATVKQNVKTLSQSMERYYLVNNVYPTSLSNLDIEIKPAKNTDYYINGHSIGGIIMSNGKYLLNYFVSNTSVECISYDGSKYGNSEGTRLLIAHICQQETGKKIPNSSGNYYSNYKY